MLPATTAPRLGMVAGETSGDLLASLLLKGLHQRWPGLRAGGIGGPRMQAEGFDAWVPSEKLSVFGYVDALLRIHELLWIRRKVGSRLLLERPDVFVGIDAPDFNFGLERRLKEGGIKTVHFVCPSIWAWRGERVNRIKASADHVLCLFPFEPEILQKAGVPATYVGHPLADTIPFDPPKAEARAALGLPERTPVVALLPGSRKSEIEHLAHRFVQAAARMHRARPDLCFVLPAAPGQEARVEAIVERERGAAPIMVLDGRSHEALAACDVTLVASGTATLEAALFGRPMVIAYALSGMNYRRMKKMAYQPWVGLPNVMAREFLVPELIQDAATPDALAREALAWLDDATRADRVRARFGEIHRELKRDTARQSADAIAQVLDR